jgi:O-acetyl-ADP-ribose deacetylase (regulator of RNase III)
MVLHIVKGDLLKSDCDVIAHQANCQSIMGAGIAKQIRKLYPNAYLADKYDTRHPIDKLGSCSYTKVNGKFIFNLYGQLQPGRGLQTDYESLKNSIIEMMQVLIQFNGHVYDLKIGFPYKIGCGLAGGDWRVVSKLLEQLSSNYLYDFYLYKLN